MNKLATIQRLHSIQRHPNEDVEKLEVGKVMEWPVVIPKGQYKDGELVVFIAIDSIVPESNPYFEFMRRQKFRIWNARFKGAPSSGLVCPISILPERVGFDGDGNEREIIAEEGDDVSEILGITKYERPLDLSTRGDAAGGFPTSLISISDEDNMLSNSKSLEELHGKEIYITQKTDGSSTTFIYNTNPNFSGGEFKACSRRFELKEGSGFPWFSVTKYDIKNKLIALGKNLAIQAESIGPKLNGNTMELKEPEIRVFRIKDLDKREILGFYDLKAMCEQLQLPMVDIIEVCQFDKTIHNIEYFRQLADSQVWSTNGKPAEGMVVAPTIPFYSPSIGKEWSLKLINQNYKQ